MKTAFTFNTRWYWGDEHEKQPPSWWTNFLKDRPLNDAVKELEQYASFRFKSNGNMRIVFKSASDLSFFILRYS